MPEENKNQDLQNKEEEKSKFIKTMNIIYDKATSGMTWTDIPPAQKLANKYIEKYKGDKYLAAKALIRSQWYKTFWTWFVSWLWWLPLLPFSLPADLTSSLFIEMRMIASIACVWWYSISSDKVRTLTFMCLLWWWVKKNLKNAWIKVWKKITQDMLKKVPNKVFVELNKKIWMQLFSKIWTKWVISTSRAVPVMWWFIWWWVNLYYTRGVWKKAINTFILWWLSDEEIEKYWLDKENISLKDKIKNIKLPKINFKRDNKNTIKKEKEIITEEDFDTKEEKIDEWF